MSTYSTTVPQVTDPINTTYAPISSNFSILDTTFNTDHVPPTDATSANWGKHKQVTLQVSAAAPSPSGTDSAVYAKTVSGVQQLFFKNSAGTETQITGIESESGNGYVMLPGGIVMQWGSTSLTAGATTTISFPTTFGTAVYSISVTLKRASSDTSASAVVVGTPTTSSFGVILPSGANNNSCYWMAIGK